MIHLIKIDSYWASYIPYCYVHIGHFLKRLGIPYKILHNTYRDQWNADKKLFLKTIEQDKPDVVCFSVITGRSVAKSCQFAKEIKARYPKKEIVFGGVHATLMAKQLIKEPYIDKVFVGEGDYVENGYEGGISDNILELGLTEPEDIYFDFSQLNMKKYVYNGSISILTSRGCPYDCQFCVNQSLNNRKWRPIPIERVVEAIDFLKTQKGVEKIHINDDNFYVDMNRAQTILKYIDMPTFSEIRIDALVKKFEIGWLYKLKCQKLMSGAESCNDKTLNRLKKGHTYEDLKNLATIFKYYPKMKASWSFILGFPWQTIKDLELEIKRMKELNRLAGYRICNPGMLLPYPGSPVYDECLKAGFKEPQTPEQWGKYERYHPILSRGYPPSFEYPWLKHDDIIRLWNLYRRDL